MIIDTVSLLKMKINTSFLCALLAIGLMTLPIATTWAQTAKTIHLDNPSFEDVPRVAQPPQGWYDCGFAGESPPDVQPNAGFEVTKPAVNGSTYLGLVVRDNNTWEAVGQRLHSPLIKGQEYTFTLSICRSESYRSVSRTTNATSNYITPVIVRIWGGTSYCSKEENLSDSEPIANTAFRTYTFRIKPTRELTYIMIEAFYKLPTIFPYNGNVLIDNASDIVPIGKVIAKVDPPKPKVTPPTPKPKVTPPAKPPVIADKPKETPKKPVEEPKSDKPVFADLGGRAVKEGEVLKIEKLQFTPMSAKIDSASSTSLEDLYQFMLRNPNVIVEIGGHTNSLPSDETCDRLSTERARAVVDFLIGKGIESRRMSYKGYGKRFPTASNATKEGQKANQRVEIKILSLNG